jgi:hypothetical protein
MNTRFAAGAIIAVLTAIGGWALLVRVEEAPSTRSADVAPAVQSPVQPTGVVDEGTSRAEPAEPARATGDSRAQAADWTRRYHESTDDFLLATELVPAALTGDGAAQHQLSRLLLHCEVYKRILAAYTEGTVAERVEFHLSSAKLAEPGRSQFRQGALRCGTLFTDDPFAGYDVPDDAKDFRYWADRAVESGDPVAVVNRLFDTAVGRSGTDDAKRKFRESSLGDLRRVVFSGSAAALYKLGGMLSHPSIVADPADGYAWSIAACESGYDCSNTNPDVGFGCVARGTCERGSTYLDVLQRDLGAGRYATIYAKAQDIQYKIKTSDWDGLQQYLEIE